VPTEGTFAALLRADIDAAGVSVPAREEAAV